MLLSPPRAPLRGRASPPGSKSITNRALLLAALARPGLSRLTGALKSQDTERMSAALTAMGVRIEEPDATTFLVESRGRLDVPKAPLFLGNAGTAMRFLTAAAVLVEGRVQLDGDEHMRRRPIGALVEALKALGVEAAATDGRPPVTVTGSGGVCAGRVEIDASLSSQFVSALLMMAGGARQTVEVALKGEEIGARGYVDLTLGAMRAFGGEAVNLGAGRWRVEPTGYQPRDLAVEPDASAATYLWAAERLTGGRIDLGVSPSRLTQPDAQAFAVMAAFPRLPAVIDGSQMQDAVPTLAVLSIFNDTPVRFVGVANLRVKECDRLRALSTEISRLKPGLAWEEGDDLCIAGDPALAGQERSRRLRTYADHRMAMSLALAGLRIGGVEIEDPGCVAKTWPGYWTALAGLGVEMRLLPDA
jgi:3-phosphoshikimate 1-carboxyvinyltransferase